jgi:hypothetical protein
MTGSADRHLDLVGFERCLATGVPVEFPVDGHPSAAVFIDPAAPAIGVRVPDDGSRPLVPFEHLAVRTIHQDNARWIELLITDGDVFLDGYPLLCAIVDRIQLQELSVAVAVAETLRLHGRLLRKTSTFPIEAEVGLLGELLVLGRLIRGHGSDDAIESWCGPAAEEHDFIFQALDLEVKTTHGERRTHWISSLHQLDVDASRRLWLLSLQLTGAAPGQGTTLPECIAELRKRIGRGAQRDALDTNLSRLGWSDIFAETTRTRWRLRSEPAAYVVDTEFPRLTSVALTAAGIDIARVPEVRYRIDLTGLTPVSEFPEPLRSLLKFDLEL